MKQQLHGRERETDRQGQLLSYIYSVISWKSLFADLPTGSDYRLVPFTDFLKFILKRS